MLDFKGLPFNSLEVVLLRVAFCLVFWVPFAWTQSIPNPRQSADLGAIFDLKSLPTLNISITVSQWNKLLSLYDQNKRFEKKVKADFRFEKDGKVSEFKDIGFRIRGNMSRKRPEGDKGEMHNPDDPKWHQAHFKIDFNKYHKEQNFRGLKALNLKFFNNDPTHVREVFCYDLLQRFGVWTAPLSSYARVYVKVGALEPAYFGVYQMIENIDKTYLKHRFESSDRKGDLWKCLWQNTGPADLMMLRADTDKIGMEVISLNEKESYRPAYDLKTPKKQFPQAKARFLAMLEQLNSLEGPAFDAWLEDHFDTDLFLRFLAVNTLVGMWDDYWVNANNYYLYMSPKGRLYFIPYDYDNSLGTSHIVPNSGTQPADYWGAMDYSRPLVYKILSQPKHKATYHRYIDTLLKGDFDSEKAIARVKTFQNLIALHVVNDTGKNMRIEDKPADWARKPFYRLLSGDDKGMAPEANYFKTRHRFIRPQ